MNNGKKSLSLTERLDLLQEAHEELSSVIDKVRKATRGTDYEGQADAYLLPQLTMSLDNTHSYLSMALSIGHLMEHLGEDMPDDGDGED